MPDDDEGTEIEVHGRREGQTEDGLTQLDLTATCRGEKVLGPGPGDGPDALTPAGPVGKIAPATRTLVAPWGE